MTHPALRLYAALEAGTNGEQLRDLFTPDATTTEHPNLITPAGALRDLEQVLAGSVAGAGLLAGQRYDVHDLREAGDTAAIRLTWTATIARDAGPFAAGQQLTAHIAQFVRIEGERIAAIETYDCYEPF